MTKPKRDLLDILTPIVVLIAIIALVSIVIGMWLTVIIPAMNGNINP